MSSRNHPFSLPVIVTLLFVAVAVPGRAQYTAALKAQTFRTIDGLFTLSYEQALNRRVSAELSLQGGNYINVRLTPLEQYKVTGVGAIGALRYYPFTKKLTAPRGFFGYAAIRYIDFNETFLMTASNDAYKVGGNIINGGLGTGYKFVYRRLGLEAFIGWGIGRLKSEDDGYRNNIPEFHQKSLEEQEHFPQLDVSVCYMFSPFLTRRSEVRKR